MSCKPSTRPRWHKDQWDALTTTDKLVYIALDAMRTEQGNPVAFHAPRLARELGIGQRTIYTILKRLELDHGMIKRESIVGSRSVVRLKPSYSAPRRAA